MAELSEERKRKLPWDVYMENQANNQLLPLLKKFRAHAQYECAKCTKKLYFKYRNNLCDVCFAAEGNLFVSPARPSAKSSNSSKLNAQVVIALFPQFWSRVMLYIATKDDFVNMLLTCKTIYESTRDMQLLKKRQLADHRATLLQMFPKADWDWNYLCKFYKPLWIIENYAWARLGNISNEQFAYISRYLTGRITDEEIDIYLDKYSADKPRMRIFAAIICPYIIQLHASVKTLNHLIKHRIINRPVYNLLNRNPNISLEYIQDNPELPWDYDDMFENRKYALDDIARYPGIPWDLKAVASNHDFRMRDLWKFIDDKTIFLHIDRSDIFIPVIVEVLAGKIILEPNNIEYPPFANIRHLCVDAETFQMALECTRKLTFDDLKYILTNCAQWFDEETDFLITAGFCVHEIFANWTAYKWNWKVICENEDMNLRDYLNSDAYKSGFNVPTNAQICQYFNFNDDDIKKYPDILNDWSAISANITFITFDKVARDPTKYDFRRLSKVRFLHKHIKYDGIVSYRICKNDMFMYED